MGVIGKGSSKRHGGIPGVRSLFSQLSVRDQESVGADKVPLFLRSVNKKGRMAIFPDLEDNEGAYGLT